MSTTSYAAEVLLMLKLDPVPCPKFNGDADVGSEIKLFPSLETVYGADKEIVFPSMLVTKIAFPEPSLRAEPISKSTVSFKTIWDTGAVKEVVIATVVSVGTYPVICVPAGMLDPEIGAPTGGTDPGRLIPILCDPVVLMFLVVS